MARGRHTINLATAGTYALTITAADDGRGDAELFSYHGIDDHREYQRQHRNDRRARLVQRR